METEISRPEVFPASMDSAGRVLIPIELRRPMALSQDSELSWVRDENGLHLKSFKEIIAEIQEYYLSLSPPEDVWSEELIAERKREAKIEAEKEARDV